MAHRLMLFPFPLRVRIARGVGCSPAMGYYLRLPTSHRGRLHRSHAPTDLAPPSATVSLQRHTGRRSTAIRVSTLGRRRCHTPDSTSARGPVRLLPHTGGSTEASHQGPPWHLTTHRRSSPPASSYRHPSLPAGAVGHSTDPRQSAPQPLPPVSSDPRATTGLGSFPTRQAATWWRSGTSDRRSRPCSLHAVRDNNPSSARISTTGPGRRSTCP